MNKRADIGFGSALDDFDTEEWRSAPSNLPDAPAPEAVRKAAQSAGFKVASRCGAAAGGPPGAPLN